VRAAKKVQEEAKEAAMEIGAQADEERE